MKHIELTRGKFTLVDDGWVDYLSQWKWKAIRFSSKYPDKFYAGRTEKVGSKMVVVWMHRVINNTPDGMKTDHVDGDTLNNTDKNLRSSTHAENIHNQGKQKHNTSGYKGVTRSGNKWVSRIAVNGNRIYLGTFNNINDAGIAYDNAASLYHKQFARLNFGE